MKLTKTCARFLRKNGGTLLAIGASVGVVLTAIETGKATIKAEKLVELNKDVPEYDMKEKVKDCWQFYIPAAVLGAGTIGCIIGSNMLSRKEIASLSAAYVALGKSYQQYRRQVAERIGAEEEKKLRIRPIFNDADLFTIKVQVATTGLSKVEDKYKAFIKQVIRSRKEYRGSGTPAMFTTEDALTEMLLLEDGMGRTLYADEAALARKLRVSKIVTVPEMDGRKGAKGGDLAAVIVNLRDYTVGADKGGAVSMFDDFDIDYNAMKYLIETRCSGALTTPYSAMAIEWAAA